MKSANAIRGATRFLVSHEDHYSPHGAWQQGVDGVLSLETGVGVGVQLPEGLLSGGMHGSPAKPPSVLIWHDGRSGAFLFLLHKRHSC